MNMIEQIGRMVYESEVIEPEDREGIFEQLVKVLIDEKKAAPVELERYRNKYGMKTYTDRFGSECKGVFHPNGRSTVFVRYKQTSHIPEPRLGKLVFDREGHTERDFLYPLSFDMRPDNFEQFYKELGKDDDMTAEEIDFLRNAMADIQFDMHQVMKAEKERKKKQQQGE